MPNQEPVAHLGRAPFGGAAMRDRDDADALRDYLAARDAACPNCGYNLRGLASPACPECNQGLSLGVHLAEPALGTYVATLAAAFATGGAGALSTAVFLALSWHFGSYPPEAVFVLPLVAAILGTGAGAFLGRRHGRMWFRSRPARTRVGLVIASWVTLGLLACLYVVHLIVGVL